MGHIDADGLFGHLLQIARIEAINEPPRKI
jgi:hypothetical protein